MAERLTEAKRKKIIAEYIKCRNYSEVGRKYGVSPNGVKKIVRNSPDCAAKCEQKAEEEMQDVLAFMDSQRETKKRLIGKILAAMEAKAENVDMFTSIKDLATAYGIILDKEFKFMESKAYTQKDENREDDPLSASLLNLAVKMDDADAD